MKDALVFIDNAYLKLVSKKLNNNTKFKYDILKFSKNISNLLNLNPKVIYLFDAPPYVSQNSDCDKLRKSKFDKFIDSLKNLGVVIRLGRLQKIGFQFNQKGVDTQITMALLIEPFQEKINQIILITSDSDFVPAIEYIKSKEKNVYLFCYNDFKRNSRFSTSNELRKTCNKVIQLERNFF